MKIQVSVESFPVVVEVVDPKTGRMVETTLGITKKGEVIADGDQGIRAVNAQAFRELNVAKGKP